MIYQVIRQIQTLQIFQVIQREGTRVQTGQQVSLQFQAPQGLATFKPATLDLHINTENHIRGEHTGFFQSHRVLKAVISADVCSSFSINREVCGRNAKLNIYCVVSLIMTVLIE